MTPPADLARPALIQAMRERLARYQQPEFEDWDGDWTNAEVGALLAYIQQLEQGGERSDRIRADSENGLAKMNQELTERLRAADAQVQQLREDVRRVTAERANAEVFAAKAQAELEALRASHAAAVQALEFIGKNWLGLVSALVLRDDDPFIGSYVRIINEQLRASRATLEARDQ